MAMHHDFTEIFLMEKKIVANPKQIMRILLFQRNAGSHASMCKKEVATRERQIESTQKIKMICRHRYAKSNRHCPLRARVSVVRRGHTIRSDGVESAYILPLRKNGRIFQESDREIFMIALEEHGVDSTPAGDE